MFFVFIEAIKLIPRAKSSFFLSLISTSISVLLITVSFILINLSAEFQARLKGSFRMNLFLEDNIPENRINDIRQKLAEEKFINTAEYIDKEKAAEIFIKETGEDFRKLLDYNPLPASFSLTLNEAYVGEDSIRVISSYLSELEGVDEVSYQDEFIHKILSYISGIKKYVFLITAGLLFLSVYLIYSTIKLIMNSRYEELETMKLVGAKISTIKLPIIINGMFIGILAGIIALGILLVVFSYLKNSGYIDEYPASGFLKRGNYLYFVLFFCIGPLLTLAVSLVSLRKITLKI